MKFNDNAKKKLQSKYYSLKKKTKRFPKAENLINK